MAEVLVKGQIDVSADAVWETIRRFGGIEEFLPMIDTCSLEGSGVGAKRTLVTGDGAKILEELILLDDQQRTLSYKILDSPLPFADYVATMQVRDLGENRCEIEWSSTFEPTEAAESDCVEMLTDLYTSGIEGLEKLLGD